MRIAIDVRKINDFGIGTYLRNLIRHLPRFDAKNEYHLLCYPQDAELLQSLSAAYHHYFVSAPNYSLSEHWSIPLALRRIDADLFHAPHYVLPALVPCPSVVTVHDVTPVVKIIDFGIAKAAGKVGKTQAGILKGKFGYMSPEQVRGLPIDRRSDIFSTGIVLYELLTNERLFVGDVVVTWTGAPCPPSDNQDVAWVDITIDHTVPIFFPWVPGNGDLSSSTEFRMEPEP